MKLAPLLLSLSLVGCASYRVGPADVGQALDSATTAVAIYGTGAVESNVFLAGAVSEPVGMAAVAAAKAALVVAGKSVAPEACRPVSGALFGLGAAAGINNVAVILGAVTPGFVAVIPGAFLLWWLYDHFDWWQADCTEG